MVYYNYTGHTDCLGDAEENDPYGMFDGWDFQACTEMILMSYGIRNGSVLPPEPFNMTDLLAGCRASTGLPPRPYWIPTEFGGFVSSSIRTTVFVSGLGLKTHAPGSVTNCFFPFRFFFSFRILNMF
jgi:lysosomal Pro-X carboxypeptidase